MKNWVQIILSGDLMMLTKLMRLSPSSIYPAQQVRVQSAMDTQARSQFTVSNCNALNQTELFRENWDLETIFTLKNKTLRLRKEVQGTKKIP